MKVDSGIWSNSLRDMEIESSGYGGLVSGIWRYSLGIWSNSLRDMEVESTGYRGNLRHMEVESRDME